METTDNDSKRDNGQYLHPATYDQFILVLTIIFLLIVLALMVLPLSSDAAAILLRIDLFFCLLFLVDFLLTLWRVPSKFDYFFKRAGWLELLGTIPALPGTPFCCSHNLHCFKDSHTMGGPGNNHLTC